MYTAATGGSRTRDLAIAKSSLVSLGHRVLSIDGGQPAVSVRCVCPAHWLSIDGEQPAVPENPSTVSRDLQRLDGHDPSVKTSINRLQQQPSQKVGDLSHRSKTKIPDKVRLKELTTHELSIVSQLYCPPVSLSICVSVCPSVCLCVSLSVCLCLSLSVCVCDSSITLWIVVESHDILQSNAVWCDSNN